MSFDYQTICKNLLKNVPQKRTRTIIERRFGLSRGFNEGEPERETLEAIGKSYGISRERVRQIEEEGLSRIKKRMEIETRKPFQYFAKEIKKQGNLVREETLLKKIGGARFSNEVFFLLSLAEQFERIPGNKEYQAIWTIDRKSVDFAKKVIKIVIENLEKKRTLLKLRDLCFSNLKISPKILANYLDISKIVLKNSEGLYGLRNWPEIRPRGVKDKALLVFRKEKRPLHFTEVANLIEGSVVATVHNELIKDPRFVLVGRGTYALSEWGYKAGQVKHVIFDILKNAGLI